MNGCNRFEEDGYFVKDHVFNESEVKELIEAISLSSYFQEQGTGRAGLRQVHLHVPEIRKFFHSSKLQELLNELIPGARITRSILFDKTVETNWGAQWHQDLTVCVKEKKEQDGYTAWSVKEGYVHVHPPAEVLEKMVTCRIHLDDCLEDNGPLMVIPGSHGAGKLGKNAIAEWVKREHVTCATKAGGVLCMRLLLLHASEPAKEPGIEGCCIWSMQRNG